MKIIILAGGSGKRLWPLSQKHEPKQFLKFLDKNSLFQKTIKRFENFLSSEDIFVVLSEPLKDIAEKQLKEIQAKAHILIEPAKKNTMGAIIFALNYLKDKIDEDEKVLIVPCDHLIEPKKNFLKVLSDLESQVLDRIVIFGVLPNRLETGYGHIKVTNEKKSGLYKIQAFVEKPDLLQANKLVLSKDVFWNVGIFLLSQKIFSNQLKKHNKKMFDFYNLEHKELIKNFDKLFSISIDYALLEKTKDVLMQSLDIRWSDVGSWDSIYDVMQKDKNENVTKGKVFTINTKKSLIFSKKKVISTIGLEDVLIVETKDAIFLARKGESQKVKQLIEKMEK